MAPTTATTRTGKKSPSSKLRRKKQRISKHVIMSRENKSKEGDQQDKSLLPSEALASLPTTDNTKTSEKKTKKKKKEKHVKNPNEVMAYLSGWKHRSVAGAWKFNKNTQSWLIRHMYEADKVSKEMFSLLIEYLTGLEGITRQRVQADATSRALRYKEYEAKLSSTTNQKQEQEKANDEGDISAPREDGKTITETENSPAGTHNAQVTDADSNDKKEETDRWNCLSDHDKRKEYKRARKVLDTLKGK
jgi:hypothetical protein